MLKLYDYFRSTASYRVRIALNIKKLDYEKIPVHLVNNGGEQHSSTFRKINPEGLVPVLDTGDSYISQSLAIIEYLDECWPEPPLLPVSATEKAYVRMIAQMIACDIHPINNLRVLNQLKSRFHADDEQIKDWYHHWIKLGFQAIEQKIKEMQTNSNYCYGEKVSIADIVLIPQVYNAKRFGVDLNNFPIIENINTACLQRPEFYSATPSSAAL